MMFVIRETPEEPAVTEAWLTVSPDGGFLLLHLRTGDQDDVPVTLSDAGIGRNGISPAHGITLTPDNYVETHPEKEARLRGQSDG